MIERIYWQQRINSAWERASIVWLTGVRRVGKTTLARSISGDAEYLNCDLPSTADQLLDPERFYKSFRRKILILDEVHQLPEPSRILKIAADAFPRIKVLATGSSTFAATTKFRDSLSGRKRVVHLLPVLAEELAAFGVADIKFRLLRGGLPQALLSTDHDLEFYGEWLDSFFARDIQELFHVEKRDGFLKFLELLLRQSGAQLQVAAAAKHAGLSRPTIMNYLQILQITHAITVLRPYSAGGRREIVAQPKVYGFDTGFVAYSRGWKELRSEDCGALWEHVVLELLQTMYQAEKIYYWRDKQQKEIDFVIPKGRGVCDAIECKWSAGNFETTGMKAFRDRYRAGNNFVVSPQVSQPYTQKRDGLLITFANATDLRDLL
jgi:predicted AAA+ superfamily ATPase